MGCCGKHFSMPVRHMKNSIDAVRTHVLASFDGLQQSTRCLSCGGHITIVVNIRDGLQTSRKVCSLCGNEETVSLPISRNSLSK